MNELKPCPFCGSDIVEIKRNSVPNDAPFFWIECKNCGGRSGERYDKRRE